MLRLGLYALAFGIAVFVAVSASAGPTSAAWLGLASRPAGRTEI
jgi:hypothetical protein